MDIEAIRALCKEETVKMTGHILLRMQMRGISLSEIQEVIMGGEIIEEYPDDYPYPSCLILGRTKKDRILHVVVGTNGASLWIVTAYEPSLEKWTQDYKERRGKI